MPVDPVPPELLDALAAEPPANGAPPAPTNRFTLSASGDVIDRARRYLDRCAPAIAGQQGHDTAFAVVRSIARGFDLSADVAFDLLQPWNARCSPPWSDAELRHKIDDALTKPFDKPRGWLLNGNGRDQTPTRTTTPAGSGYEFSVIDSSTFAAANYRPEWLIKRLLVRGQPAIVGGPRKAMKTSMLVDLAVSLGSGTPFLGSFTVYRQLRVAVLSGESGEFTLQETAQRVCRARGIDLATVSCLWGFTLPQLGNAVDLAALRVGLQAHAVDVLIIDPLYLCLLAGHRDLQATNLFDMGPLLLGVGRTCLDVGTTPILIHHSRKNLQNPFEPLDLEDLAFAGIQEFARQWMLVSRRESYELGSGIHLLWLSAGGSVGHGGLWAVDVDEGQLADDFTGRKWQVTVTGAVEAREQEAQAGDTKKQEQQERRNKSDDAAVLAALDRLAARFQAKIPQPKKRKLQGQSKAGEQRASPTKNEIRIEANLSGDRVTRALTRLVDARLLSEIPVKIATGKNLKVVKEGVGYQRSRVSELSERTERTEGILSAQSGQ